MRRGERTSGERRPDNKSEGLDAAAEVMRNSLMHWTRSAEDTCGLFTLRGRGGGVGGRGEGEAVIWGVGVGFTINHFTDGINLYIGNYDNDDKEELFGYDYRKWDNNNDGVDTGVHNNSKK